MQNCRKLEGQHSRPHVGALHSNAFSISKKESSSFPPGCFLLPRPGIGRRRKTTTTSFLSLPPFPILPSLSFPAIPSPPPSFFQDPSLLPTIFPFSHLPSPVVAFFFFFFLFHNLFFFPPHLLLRGGLFSLGRSSGTSYPSSSSSSLPPFQLLRVKGEEDEGSRLK